MRYVNWCASLIGLALLLIMSAGSAQAQATRTWVSGVGDDANPCSRTAPCKTFAGAISKTAASGEINVLDPGGFGAVTITKSITISSEGFEAGVLVSGTNGIVISAASTDVITLKGLDIEGLGTGLDGIKFLAGGALHVINSRIKHFTNSGINFAPSSGNPKLFVTDCYIEENGSGTNAGILIRPTSTATATVSVNRTQLNNNNIGFRIDTTAPGGAVAATMRDSMVSGTVGFGIHVVVAANAATMLVDHVSVTGNGAGLVVHGVPATIIANQTTVTGNGTGLLITPSGQLISYKNNVVTGNGTDGAFSSSVTPQ
ncbi:MAG TPA: right-handed parallel beta-helix repeat-containing protein [Pseudolabrys sp.]|nr:right-handed parallel beta-helix repeat-containing protein [Pseudolabrys sp.]